MYLLAPRVRDARVCLGLWPECPGIDISVCLSS